MVDSSNSSELTLFYCYDQKDAKLYKELDDHLSSLRRTYTIRNVDIDPGTDFEQVIAVQLVQADIILLLISVDLLKHDYCYGPQMVAAISRHQDGNACVVPILLRDVDLGSTPFASLNILPSDQLAVTLWEDLDEAFKEIALDLRPMVSALLDRRTTARSLNSNSRISSPATSQRFTIAQQANLRHHYPGRINVRGDLHIETTPIPRSTQIEMRDRAAMLKKIEYKWIKSVLEKSFYHKAHIALDFSEQPHLVSDPWSDAMQEQASPTGPLSLDALSERMSSGSLLILGRPGAGKTTLMLETLRDRLKEARVNEADPIPIVFNLSSWVKGRLPLDQWLVEELKSKYNVSRKQASFWVKERAILPLLDGLDEVAQPARAACLNAINLYHDGLTPLIVCSRQAEYEQLVARTEKKLNLDTAILIQELTLEQIDQYFSQSKPPLPALNAAIHTNPTLRELADTPLMLNVLAEVSKSTPLQQVQVMPVEQIFEVYIQNMLRRRGRLLSYTTEQMRYWLSYLAGQMARRGQTEFYQEQLQKDWLPERGENIYRLALGIVFGLIIGFVMILVYTATFFLNPDTDKLQIVTVGIAYVAFFIFLYGILFNFLALSPAVLPSTPLRKAAFSLKMRANWLLQQPIAYGLLIGLVHYFLIKNFVLLSAAAVHSMFIAVGFAIIGRIDMAISPAEDITWSWYHVRSNLWKFLGGGLLCGLGISLIAGPFTALVIDNLQGQKSPPIPLTPTVFFYLLLVGLACGLVFGLIFMWISGISYTIREKSEKQVPNQGIYRSARNSLILGLSSGLLVGALMALLFGPGASWLKGVFPNLYNKSYVPTEAQGICWGIGIGIAIVAMVGLRNGGVVCLQHYLLRFLLTRSGVMPWRYTNMLDEATKHNLLYKVGGGYRFIHDLFLKHFASLASAELLTNEPRDLASDPLAARRTVPQVVKTEWFLAPAILVILLLVVIVGGSNIKNYFDAQNAARDAATALATASVTHPYPSYFPPAHPRLVSFEPLTHEGIQWDTRYRQYWACHFLQSGYEVHNANRASTLFCLKDQPLRNFAMTATMILKQGDCGGLVFHATFQGTIKNYYFLDICVNGQYGFGENFGGDDSHLPTNQPLTFYSSSTIQIRYQEKNLIAMVASNGLFTFYLNQHEIFQTQNADIAQGDFGFTSGNLHENSVTDVLYTDLAIWSLP